MKKSALFFCFLCLVVLTWQCKSEPENETKTYTFLAGKTMGTTYHMKFDGSDYRNYQYEIDSVLTAVNQSMSTYIDISVISDFNKSETPFILDKNPKKPILDPLELYFYQNFQKSKEIWKMSNGAFDPTVGALVNYWGFGNEGLKRINEADTQLILEIVDNIGFQNVELQERMSQFILTKTKPGIKLDFNALAKGFGVDLVSELFQLRGIENYMVEIGGEVRTKGVNDRGAIWTLGINRPDTEAVLNDFFATLPLENKAMASSGNYRNFYEVDGQKRFHSINPKTGFPEENSMRSATIIADDCMTADAIATACMVMGITKAKSLIYMMDDISAFFIYEDESGENQYFASPGLAFELVNAQKQ